MFASSRGDATCCLLKKRMVELERHVIAQRKVARPNEEQVKARYSCNLINRFDRFAVLDLKGKKDLFIRMFQIFTRISQTKVCICACTIKSAFPKRWKTRPLHPLPGFFGASNVRNHQPIRTEFKRLHGAEVATFYNTDHQIHTGCPTSQRLGINCIYAEWTMLQIKPDDIVTNLSNNLRQPWICYPADAGNLYKASRAKLS